MREEINYSAKEENMITIKDENVINLDDDVSFTDNQSFVDNI